MGSASASSPTRSQFGDEMTLEVPGSVTQRSVLDALEARYPMLRSTIRDHVTQKRRPLLPFFACEEDLSHEPLWTGTGLDRVQYERTFDRGD
jgi:hypothetical protein